MARLADIQAARLAGALLTGDAVKRDAPFTLISRRKVRFWIGASATVAAIILVSWKVESHDSQSSGFSLGEQSPIQEKDMKFTQAMSVAVAAGSICSGVMAQSTAVQWTVASGGNGHWYELMQLVGPSQSAEVHFELANSIGGYTATIGSSAENQFCLAYLLTIGGNRYPIIGVRKQADTNQGAWVTGEAWSFTRWHSGEGSNSWERYATLNSFWNGDWQDTDLTPHPESLVEYSADCNSDGIVDYGQILSGQLTDTNSNGIPDICEIDPCPGDINLNSVVDAVDLAMVLTSWGTSGGEYPRADVNHDGVVNGPDLGALLGGWGSCP